MNGIIRCPWVTQEKIYIDYHDTEWGVPVHDDTRLFECLTLEGAQAGLSWITVLKKREHYRKVYDGFDIKKVSLYDEQKIEELLKDPGIIRNRLKVLSSVNNARKILEVQKEYGSFSEYIWGFVNNVQISNSFKRLSDYPAKTELSDKMSVDLRKRGFKFIGSTIIYAFLQAVGVLNDHTIDCFKKK